MEKIKWFWANESGATAIEYALIGTLISVAILVGLAAVSGNLETIFNGIATAVSDAMSD